MSEQDKQFQSLCTEAQSDTADWQDVVARAIAFADARLKIGDKVGAQQYLQVAALCSSLHRQTESAIAYIQKALQIGPDEHLDTLLEQFRNDLEYRRKRDEQT